MEFEASSWLRNDYVTAYYSTMHARPNGVAVTFELTEDERRAIRWALKLPGLANTDEMGEWIVNTIHWNLAEIVARYKNRKIEADHTHLKGMSDAADASDSNTPGNKKRHPPNH